MTMWAINLDIVENGKELLATDKLRLPKTMSANERVLLYKKRGDEVDFVQTTSIEFAKTVSISGLGEEVIAIQLRTPLDLKSPSSLSAMTYSLELIARFDDPSRHFNRPIRRISVDDFDTIEKQSIFWARSAFGFYLNALPTDRFIEFVQHVAMRSPGLLIESPNFQKLWPLLRDWIQEEYVDAHQYAAAIRESISRIVNRGTKLDFRLLRVSLSDEKMATSGWLSDLVSKLETFYLSMQSEKRAAETRVENANGETSIFREIDERIAENLSSERAFEKLFEGKKWPTTQLIKI